MNLNLAETQTDVILFNGIELLSKKIDEIIWVALKPIVEGMGLEWSRQSQKVQNDKKFNYVHMSMVASDNKSREMLCLDAYQLPAFLYSINPNKVRIDLRDRIISFQNETFRVINEYWNKKTEITQNLFQGKSVAHTINGLKSGLSHKDRRISMLESRVQELSSKNESLKIENIKFYEEWKANESFVNKMKNILGVEEIKLNPSEHNAMLEIIYQMIAFQNDLESIGQIVKNRKQAISNYVSVFNKHYKRSEEYTMSLKNKNIGSLQNRFNF